MLQREEHTDVQGAATLTLNSGQEPTAQPRAYIIEATVTGADDQSVTSTQPVLALPAVVLGLNVPRYVERVQAIDAQIIAVGTKSELIAAQSIPQSLKCSGASTDNPSSSSRNPYTVRWLPRRGIHTLSVEIPSIGRVGNVVKFVSE